MPRIGELDTPSIKPLSAIPQEGVAHRSESIAETRLSGQLFGKHGKEAVKDRLEFYFWAAGTGETAGPGNETADARAAMPLEREARPKIDTQEL